MNDEQIKEAMTDLFVQSAAESGIDLEKLSSEQVRGMYAQWESEFLKAAEEDKDDDDDDVVEKAKQEHEEKKQAMAKIAEVDFLGRRMAHSFADEMDKISGKHLDDVKRGISRVYNRGKDIFTGKGVEKLRKSQAETGREYATMRDKLKGISKSEAGFEGTDDAWQLHRAKKLDDFRKGVADINKKNLTTEKRKMYGARGAAGALMLSTAAGGGYAAGHNKKSSAFDALAAELAVEKAAAAGFDPEECAEKLAALAVLDLVEESDKVAGISDTETALHVRASELLETAGYPIDWSRLEGLWDAPLRLLQVS